jgi:hypothetical protein
LPTARPLLGRLALVAGALLVGAYLALLQVRANDREPPLVVTWTAGVAAQTVRHPRTGRAGWGVQADVDALIARITGARGWRTTAHLRSDAETFSLRVEDVRGRRVALAEVPAGGLGALELALRRAACVALVLACARPLFLAPAYDVGWPWLVSDSLLALPRRLLRAAGLPTPFAALVPLLRAGVS